MDRFVTSTRVNPSGASSSKRKVRDDIWLEQYEVIENNGRNGRENVDLNSKYAADVEAVLFEHSIRLGSEAESLDSSDSSDSD